MGDVKLPTFLVCGAAKSGTTSLYVYLREHPNIYMSTEKETRFFSTEEKFAKGVEWYKQFFSQHSGERAVGEADTGIMYLPGSARRVHSVNPDMKLIFLLRNPVEKVYSAYWFGIDRGIYDTSTRSFSEFIRDHQNRWTQRVLDAAKYCEQLARFDEYFQPDQKKVVLFRRFTNETEAVVREIYDFVGVDASFRPEDLGPKNVTSYPSDPGAYRQISRLWRPIRSRLPTSLIEQTASVRGAVKDLLFSEEKGKPTMNEDDRRYLREYYRDHNDRLEEYLGRDLSHWT